MKNLICVLVIIFYGLVACAQSPPSRVSERFSILFPNVKNVKWEQVEENEWEVEFEKKGSKISASFDTEGVWQETESELKHNCLPTFVKVKLTLSYWGYKMSEVEKIEKSDFWGYEITMINKEKEIELSITSDGKITAYAEEDKR